MTAVELGARRTAAAAGALHALLFVLSYWLLTSTPGVRSPDAEIAAFYSRGDGRRIVLTGLYLMPFAGIAFLWFCAALRACLRLAEGGRGMSEVFGAMHLASGLLYVALFFAGAAAASVMAVSVQYAHAEVDPLTARQLPQLGQTLLMVFAMRMAAMFTFTTSRLGRAARLLPRWFALVGLVVGLFLLLSASFDRRMVLVFPAWLLALCVLLLLPDQRRDGRAEG